MMMLSIMKLCKMTLGIIIMLRVGIMTPNILTLRIITLSPV